jgi:hypothetical protein
MVTRRALSGPAFGVEARTVQSSLVRENGRRALDWECERPDSRTLEAQRRELRDAAP